jgi:hypothetical protein
VEICGHEAGLIDSTKRQVLFYLCSENTKLTQGLSGASQMGASAALTRGWKGMAYLLGMLIGGLVPTFLFSRLMLFILKRWKGGARRLVVAHCVSLLICVVLGGFGFSRHGEFAWIQALTSYSLQQVF